MVNTGRGATDCIKVFQEEMLAIIYPLAGISSLDKCEYWFSGVDVLHITYQHIPMLYIIESINTAIKVSHEAEGLNPEQKMCCEELVNCLIYFLNTRTATRNLYKMLCPEVAGISQYIPNLGFLQTPPQPFPHHIEA